MEISDRAWRFTNQIFKQSFWHFPTRINDNIFKGLKLICLMCDLANDDDGPETDLREDDRACLFARWIDQHAYRLNKPTVGAPDHLGAIALYRRIPEDGPLFARCRRENGLGWARLRLGEAELARAHAVAGVEAAGDAGSLRMRAMALNLLAACSEGDEAERIRERARAIARSLEDEALLVRFSRVRGS